MEKTVIGNKLCFNIFTVIAWFAGGMALIAGGVLAFTYVGDALGGVIGSAIGGGAAGALIFLGAALCSMAVAARTLPDELVHIDDKAVYLRNASIPLEQIKCAENKGHALIITLLQGRKVMRQGLLKNSIECAKQINERLHAQSK